MSPIFQLSLAQVLLCIPATLALSLGSNAQNFGVCASSTVTNSGFTVITGDLGLNPGTSYTGFPPGTATSYQIGSASAIACGSESATTYGTCIGLSTGTGLDYTGIPLDGLTLDPGVYNFDTTASLDGTLTFDAANDANAQLIFKIGTSLTTAADSIILLVNGAQACNIFWCVGSSASIGANNTFLGPLIADAVIAVGTSTSDEGGFFSRSGAVTLLNNAILSC